MAIRNPPSSDDVRAVAQGLEHIANAITAYGIVANRQPQPADETTEVVDDISTPAPSVIDPMPGDLVRLTYRAADIVDEPAIVLGRGNHGSYKFKLAKGQRVTVPDRHHSIIAPGAWERGMPVHVELGDYPDDGTEHGWVVSAEYGIEPKLTVMTEKLGARAVRSGKREYATNVFGGNARTRLTLRTSGRISPPWEDESIAEHRTMADGPADRSDGSGGNSWGHATVLTRNNHGSEDPGPEMPSIGDPRIREQLHVRTSMSALFDTNAPQEVWDAVELLAREGRQYGVIVEGHYDGRQR